METPRPAGISEQAESFLQSIEEMILGQGSLREVLGLAEDDIQELAAEGDALLEAGRLTDALSVYEGCAALDPADWTLFQRLGLCHAALGDTTRARDCLSTARELESGEAQLHGPRHLQ